MDTRRRLAVAAVVMWTTFRESTGLVAVVPRQRRPCLVAPRRELVDLRRRRRGVAVSAGSSSGSSSGEEKAETKKIATSIASLYASPAQAHDTVTVRERDGRILPIPQQKRYRSREWLRNLAGIPSSKTLRRIRSPVVGLTAWGAVVGQWQKCCGELGLTFTFVHAIMGSTLGLLLTFRTNAAYTRYNEGRKVWQNVVDRCRDIARLSAVFADCLGPDRYARVVSLLRRFPLVLQYHLDGRPKPARRRLDDVHAESKLATHYATKSLGLSSDVVFEKRDDDDERLVSLSGERLFEDGDDAADEQLPGLTRVANQPLYVANALAAEFRSVPDSPDASFTSRERGNFLGLVASLSSSIGACERLIMTPVPLGYARHTSRFLSLWCLSLPFVLAPALGPTLTPLVMALVSWGLFGIQEIGLVIEDPFRGSLKLGVLADIIHCDVDETNAHFRRPFSSDGHNPHGTDAEIAETARGGVDDRSNGREAPPATPQEHQDRTTQPGLGSLVSPRSAAWSRTRYPSLDHDDAAAGVEAISSFVQHDDDRRLHTERPNAASSSSSSTLYAAATAAT